MPKEFELSDTKETIEEKKDSEAVIEQTSPNEEPIEKKEVVEKIEKAEKKEKKLSKFFKNIPWKKLLFPTVAFLTLVGIGLFYYFGIYKLKPTPLYQVLALKDPYILSNPNDKLFDKNLALLSKPDEPRTEESPLNGLLFSKTEMDVMMKRRPVAVMINNHADARPQSGLGSADIVIEANAEGGITRHLAIFWSKAPEKVGPIRSLRQSYLEWLSEYDPILIRDGCAETDNPKTNACGNLYTYGIKDISTLGAWRYNDGRRVAPHNEYSSVINAWAYGEKMNWDSFPSTIQSFEFKRDADVKDRGSKTVVKMIFHTRLVNEYKYDTIWTYDKSTNTYFRKIGNVSDMDQETNTLISAKVVIAQQVKTVHSGDDKGRIITTTIGEGDAVILQDGKIINGKWKKDSRTDRTKYYDSSGNPIKFNRGKLWIAMIPQIEGKFDIIEQ
jgi:hypothetical protein